MGSLLFIKIILAIDDFSSKSWFKWWIKNWNCDGALFDTYFGLQISLTLEVRPRKLGNYLAYKTFAVQTILWSMEFVIQNKSGAQHHCSLKLGSKVKHLNKNWNTVIDWSDTVWCFCFVLLLDRYSFPDQLYIDSLSFPCIYTSNRIIPIDAQARLNADKLFVWHICGCKTVFCTFNLGRALMKIILA